MNKLYLLSALALIPLAAGCDLEVGDLNNPSESELQERPTPTLIRAAASGLLIGARAQYGRPNGYLSHLAVLGREAYNFDAADPRFRSEMLSGPGLNPGSPAFGGNLWNVPYANIHNALNLLGALDLVAGLSDEELDATRGYARTMQALDYLIVINTRDENGAAIVASTSIDVIPPLASKEAVFDHIELLLDDGDAELASGGDSFPFQLSNGFKPAAPLVGFTTPATFRAFNRALRARVAVYREDWMLALSVLEDSFLIDGRSDEPGGEDAPPPLAYGVYHSYSILPGDTGNGLISGNLFGHPSLATDAVEGDTRFAAKLVTLEEERTIDDLSSDLMFTIYPDANASIPIIHNEELLLLRAEALLRTGDLEGALADINLIRVYAAGQEELPAEGITEESLFEELIYQRRYSLLFEGHRWIDMRRWGLLDQLPIDRPGDVVHPAFPIPTPELDARQ